MIDLTRRLRALSDEELQALSEGIDAEIDHRRCRVVGRGYIRSTYMSDRVRGRRKAPRRQAA
jgi:hypothetical protein